MLSLHEPLETQQADHPMMPLLTITRVVSGNRVWIALARGMRRVARRKLSRREVGTRRSDPLLQLLHFQLDLFLVHNLTTLLLCIAAIVLLDQRLAALHPRS